MTGQASRTPFSIILGPLVALCMVTACTHTKIVTSNDCANAIVQDTTVYHYFWGLVQANDIKPPCDPRFNYLNKVEVKTTFGHFLLTLITLGVVVPQKVNYCCAPPNTTGGHLDLP